MADYKDFAEKTNEMQNAFVVAALTDEYIVDTWPMTNSTLEGKENKILEVRVFNDNKEVKIFRTDTGKKEFELRTIDDSKLPKGWECLKYGSKGERDYQEQYLDINTKESGNGNTIVKTTGGGSFYLPVSNTNDAKVKIKYYVKRDPESGMAILADWRVAGFEEA